MNYITSAASYLLKGALFSSRWLNLCASWVSPYLYEVDVKKHFTSEEKEKYKQLHKEIHTVAQQLHIPHRTNLSVEILNEESSSIYTQSNLILGIARIFIPKDYFENYGTLKEDEEWNRLQREIPDDPIQLGRYFDQVDPILRERIQELADKHISLCNQSEIQGIFAHELGHAKCFHTIQRGSISGVFVYALERCLSLLNSEDLIQNSLGFLICSIFLYNTSFGFSFPMWMQFSRHCETEADREATIAPEYSDGIISCFKKELIERLEDVPSGSCEEWVKKELEKAGSKTHPTTSKRIQDLLQLKGKLNSSPSLLATLGKVVMVSIPLFFAAQDVINFARWLLQPL